MTSKKTLEMVIMTHWHVFQNMHGKSTFIGKDKGILEGVEFARQAFKYVDPKLRINGRIK